MTVEMIMVIAKQSTHPRSRMYQQHELTPTEDLKKMVLKLEQTTENEMSDSTPQMTRRAYEKNSSVQLDRHGKVDIGKSKDWNP